MKAAILAILILCASTIGGFADFVSGRFVSGRMVNATPAGAGGGGGSNPPASPLVHQEFEGAGYDNSETWTESGFGTKDEDYTGTVIDGSQSLYCNIDTFTQGNTAFDLGGSALAEGWFFFKFQAITQLPTSSYIMKMEDASFNQILGIKLTAGNALQVVDTGAGSSADTVSTVSLNTTYWIWGHYLKGTGSDSTCEIWFSSTSTKPADGSSGHAKFTNGAGANNFRYFYLGVNNGVSDLDGIYDHVYVDDTVILSNP